MDPEERRCEACRMRAVDDVIESDEPNQPYQLCSACAHRLQTLSLRPREWFHLAALISSRLKKALPISSVVSLSIRDEIG